MSVKVDLHVHSKLSKRIPFRTEYFDRAVARALRAGLSGFALTEHLHSRDFWQTMHMLARRYPYRDGLLEVRPDFHVLTGAEVTLSDKADVTVIGPLEALAQLDACFTPTLNEGYFPRLGEVIAPARQAGLLIIGAHPVRPSKELTKLPEQLLSQLDALEISGKDMAAGPADYVIEPFAAKLGLPTVGSSDAHLAAQVGVQYTVLPYSRLTFDTLRHAIFHKTVRVRTSPKVRQIVKSCDARKRKIKPRILERFATEEAFDRVAPAAGLQLGLLVSSYSASHPAGTSEPAVGGDPELAAAGTRALSDRRSRTTLPQRLPPPAPRGS